MQKLSYKESVNSFLLAGGRRSDRLATADVNANEDDNECPFNYFSSKCGKGGIELPKPNIK